MSHETPSGGETREPGSNLQSWERAEPIRGRHACGPRLTRLQTQDAGQEPGGWLTHWGTMIMTPEYGEEELIRQRSDRLEERSEGVLPEDSEQVPEREEAPEREVAEHERADQETAYLDPESNEAQAPGQVCARCGRVIERGQDARLRTDGRWMHEVCPPAAPVTW